jgi:hypothetical protein
MTLTQAQVDALQEGAAGDILVSQYAGWRVPHPTIDMAAIQQVEGEIKRLGLVEDYTAALKHIVQHEDGEDMPKDWLMATATPLQRAKAFLTLHVG